MTPGRPPPPFAGEYRSGLGAIVRTCIPRLVHVTEYPAEVCGPRLAEFDRTAAAVFADAHTVPESSLDVSDPTSGPDPDPRVGHGVAHVPAACLKSCDGLRTPMSRTIESGSDRKRSRQFAARSVAIPGR